MRNIFNLFEKLQEFIDNKLDSTTMIVAFISSFILFVGYSLSSVNASGLSIMKTSIIDSSNNINNSNFGETYIYIDGKKYKIIIKKEL